MIVISGVSSGLGRALVHGLAERGKQVAGCARRAEPLEELQQHAGVTTKVVDVSDDDQVASWAREVISRHGPPALLVNNAAIINRNACLWELDANEIDRILSTNLGGTINMIRHFLPAMIEAGRGVVVNMSSGWGRSTSPQVASYCATKYGIEGLTAALSQELPSGLAAVALNPGIIDTEMLRSAWSDGASSYEGPELWAARAIPFLLNLGPRHNGRSLDIPD